MHWILPFGRATAWEVEHRIGTTEFVDSKVDCLCSHTQIVSQRWRNGNRTRDERVSLPLIWGRISGSQLSVALYTDRRVRHSDVAAHFYSLRSIVWGGMAFGGVMNYCIKLCRFTEKLWARPTREGGSYRRDDRSPLSATRGSPCSRGEALCSVTAGGWWAVCPVSDKCANSVVKTSTSLIPFSLFVLIPQN